MTRAELLCAQLRDAHQALEQTMADVSDSLVNSFPPGTANSVGERYGHLAVAEDSLIHGVLQSVPPLVASTWAGRTGISEPRFGTDPEHSRRVRIELPAARDYAGAVYGASDSYLASLSDADLDRLVDMTAPGFGHVPVWWVVSRLVIGHAYEVHGEVAAAKGALGARGFTY